MKKYTFLIGILCILFFCFFQKKTNRIQISYLDHSIETTYDISTTELEKTFETDSVQYAYVPKCAILYIIKNIQKTKKKKKSISEPRMIIKINNNKFYIDSWFGAYDANYDSISITPRAIFLLRRYTNYYNHILPEDLKYLKDIQEFGLPSNYHYQERRLLEDILKHKYPNNTYLLYNDDDDFFWQVFHSK